jgi:hypothetical protein
VVVVVVFMPLLDSLEDQVVDRVKPLVMHLVV